MYETLGSSRFSYVVRRWFLCQRLEGEWKSKRGCGHVYQWDRRGGSRKTGQSTNDTPGALEPEGRYASFFKTLKDTATP
jgi:hypothetical protein